MHRSIVGLAFASVLSSALPALAGPNGSTYPAFFPLYQQKRAATAPAPHALLGVSEPAPVVRHLPPGVRGKQPARSWQRRPSEGR